MCVKIYVHLDRKVAVVKTLMLKFGSVLRKDINQAVFFYRYLNDD